MAAEQKPPKPQSQKSLGEAQSREARLAGALRDNLRRRKAPAGQGDAQTDADNSSAGDSGKDAL